MPEATVAQRRKEDRTAAKASSLLLPAALALLAALPLPAAHAAERPYVLDRGKGTLIALAMPDGTVAGSVLLGGQPEALLRTPDGTTLLALDRGPSLVGRKPAQEAGKAVVSIVDAATMTLRARVELGNGLWGTDAPKGLVSPDGKRLTLVCPGLDSKALAERPPRELVTVDVASGRLAGRVTLEHAVTDLSGDREGRLAFLFTARSSSRDDAPARLTLVDLAGPKVVASIALEGRPQPPVLSADGRFLYLLDPGRAHKKADQRVPGSVEVVSLAEYKVVRRIDAGGSARTLTVLAQHGLAFVVSEGAFAHGLDASSGELRVLKGAGLAATVRIAPNALLLRFSAAGDRLYALGPQAVDIVDLPSLRSHPLHLDRAQGAIFQDDPGPAKDLALSPDGKRAFVLYEQSGQLLVLDLLKEDRLAMVATGRGVGRVVKSILTAPHAAMAVRPDSLFAYVLDGQSGDVTVVKAEDGTEAARLPVGGHTLHLFPGGRQLAVQARERLRLVDTQTHALGREVPVMRLHSVVPTSDGTAVLAAGDLEVVLLDAATGAERARLDGFVRAAAVVFAAAPPSR